MSEQDGPLVEAARSVGEFPGFFGAFASATIQSMCSDPLVLSLAMGSVFVGLATRKVTVGQAFFWSLYAVLRTGAGISNAIIGHAQITSAPKPPLTHSHVPTGEIFDIQPSPQQ